MCNTTCPNSFAHAQPHRSYTAPSTPLFHPQPQYHPNSHSSPLTTSSPQMIHSHSHSLSQTHDHNPSTSYPSSSSSSFYPHTPKTLSRPKPKKISSSTSKHKNVQVDLKVKVERAGCFQAFFVPLARTLPPAPPSSPILGQRLPPSQVVEQDYFGGWDAQRQKKVGRREQWVEDVSGEESMEIDSE
jgi:hypothetical protein